VSHGLSDTAAEVLARAAGSAGESEGGPAVRAYLRAVHERVADLHRRGHPGRAVNEAHAAMLDELVVRLFERAAAAAAAGQGGRGLAVAAVGGYGRRELSLHSDIDLLLLYRGPADAHVGGVAERLQRWLWDAGLTVGCATRTLEETLSLAGEDATVRTAVVDARPLAGEVEPVQELGRALRRLLHGRARELVAEQAAALAERHARYGESLYLLQPNVKEGAGGLRDYHSAYWVARVTEEDVGGLDDLASVGLLTPAERSEYAAALDFLWRVRNQLHLDTGRCTDRMSFELQEQVAQRLGYGDGPDDGAELPVERFMGDYYRNARSIQTLSELVIEQCAARVRPASARVIRPVEGGFRVVEGQLEIPEASHLREDPRRLLAAFEVAQRYDVPLSRMARRLVRENLELVDDAFRRDPAMAESLLRILAAPHRVSRTLSALNETRLLGTYLPEWEHIVCRWQHVIYHTYTVDVHSIFLVEELRRLWKGHHEADLPELTALVRDVEDRAVLFLGCLLHDIGKGRGGEHSLRGRDLARLCLERMGVAPERRERVVFLVEHHLLMAHLAQRRDLSDPRLIVEFARTVGDRTNLRNLYLLTFADIRASSRDAWNDWKGQLLRELFQRTSEFLEAGGDDPHRAVELIEARVEQRREAARRRLAELGVSEGAIRAYFDDMPRRYFVAHGAQQIARHAMAVLGFQPEQVVATRVRSMRGDFSELIVVTRDVHGLYARVAGVLTARGLDILGSHVYTTRSGLALEIYRLATPPGGPRERREAWRGVESTLHGVLSKVVRVEDLLARRRRPVGVTPSPSREPPRVSISNAESDFYTIVDVSANDRLGLLYDLTRTLAEEGLEIYISKASTILDQVADTFYVKDERRRKVVDPERLARLRASLLAVVGAPEGAGHG